MRTVLLLLPLFGCSYLNGLLDSGSDESEDSTPADTGPKVDSCSTELDTCFEYRDFDSTSSWCTTFGEQHGATTSYANAPCGEGQVYVCNVSSAQGFEPGTLVYYYSPTFDSQTAADDCTNAGGKPG